MVSFQCDGCSDVVKKPKLDQHRLRCNSSFTCIDCSKTFPTPADWKGHISCITEAEKYQKSLYKPKNNRDGAQNHNVRGQDNRFNNANNASRGRGNMPRFRATGANDTPLGTPTRMSPKLDTFTPDGDSQKAETSITPSGQKRKADEISSDKPPAADPKKTESIKKRKSDTKEPNHDTVGICSELSLHENTTDNLKTSAGASMEPEVNSEDKADAGKTEKKKKDKKKRKEEKDQDAVVDETPKVESERDGKKEKKHKKDKRKEDNSDTPVQKEDMQDEKENQIVEKEEKEKKKKSKATKKEGLKEGSDENIKPGDASDGEKKEKKDKKKKKSADKESQDVVKKEGKISKEDSDISSTLDEPSAAKEEKVKSKSSKKRKHGEDTEGTSEKVEVVAEKKKRKKD